MLINDLADIDNEVFVFLDDYHDPAIRRVVAPIIAIGSSCPTCSAR